MQYPCSQYSQCNFSEPLTPPFHFFLLQKPQVGHVENTLSLFHLEAAALGSIAKNSNDNSYIYFTKKNQKLYAQGKEGACQSNGHSYLDFLVEVPVIALLSISLDPLLLFFLAVLGKVWLLWWFAQHFNIIIISISIIIMESRGTLRTEHTRTTQLMMQLEGESMQYVMYISTYLNVCSSII